MPKLSPRRINKTAIRIAKNGLSLFNFCLIVEEMNCPKIETPYIIGRVPKPKHNIKRAPENMSWVTLAPNIAMYTNPHGRNPLKTPIPKSANLFLDLNNF